MVDVELIYKKLGKKIAQIRNEKGLTQDGLAEDSNMNRVFIGYIERAERKPTIKTVAKIADVLGVELWELFK